MKRHSLLQIAVALLLALVLFYGFKALTRRSMDSSRSPEASQTAPARSETKRLTPSDAINQIGNLESKGRFSAQFWMTTDEQIFTSWAKTGAIRSLQPTLQIKRNTPIFLALFMANPGVRSIVKAPGEKPRMDSDVTFDVYIISPNGNLALADKQRVGWRGPPPSPGLIYLAKDRGMFNFEAIDPLGEYTIALVVHDNIRKADLKLTRKLDLVD